ncbi:MAG: hypothetical protein WD696_00835 [Bryobacteraceae bacterium]
MVTIRQHLLNFGWAAAFALLPVAALEGKKFYPDDPLWKSPPPMPVDDPRARKLNEYYDFFYNSFAEPGESHPRYEPIEGRAANTLGEVPDSEWYTNRHGLRRMTLEELKRGPGADEPPSMEGPWKVVAAKAEGVSQGFTIEDVRGHRYLIKFDPRQYPELQSAAEVIGSRFFHAFGYNVPETYIVRFKRDQVEVAAKAPLIDSRGKRVPMRDKHIDRILREAARHPDGSYRAVASRFIEGKLLGPFRLHGTRTDDPNDIVPHEHRRDLRGLYVFASWIGHNDIKSLNTLDTLVEEDGTAFIRHYLIDFGASLGSDSFTAKSPRAGHEYLFNAESAARQVATLGLSLPDWARANYPDLPSVGRFEADIFKPGKWKPNYPNGAFRNCLPADAFWAAKQVMAFTDEDIRALVSTGEYSDPRAAEWLARTLVRRRDKIGQTYFARVLPLDAFALRDGRLEFEDLGVKYGIAGPRIIDVQWSHYDNARELKRPIPHATSLVVPPEAAQPSSAEAYFAVDIRDTNTGQLITVYLIRRDERMEVVGIER